MKRDMDLIREILLKIESSNENGEFSINGYSDDVIEYHLKLLRDAKFIDDYTVNIIGEITTGQLTWEGNDYLDKVRDNSTWSKTKNIIKEKGLPLIFDTIKTISSALITAAAEGVANSIIKKGGQQ